MIGHEGKEVIGSVQYCAVNKSPYRKVTMTGDEGKEVTGSAQYCAVNKSPYGKASMIGYEGKEVTGSVQYCRRRGPNTPRTYAPPAVAVWSPFLVTLQDASAYLHTPAGFLT